MSKNIRVPLVTPGTRSELADIERKIETERGDISVLYQALLNSAPLAAGWEAMLTAIRNRSSVPEDLRELMILRVAVLNRATFEFAAHLPHAQQAGIAAEKLEAVQHVPIADIFSDDERLVLALTDAMTRDIVVPDAVFERLRQRFDARTLVEVVATVAAYNMVSRFLVALNIAH
jgi:4-carboxymuconolactone decarboxylase